MDWDHPWISYSQIQALPNNPPVGCTIARLHPTKCTKCRLMDNPWITLATPRKCARCRLMQKGDQIYMNGVYTSFARQQGLGVFLLGSFLVLCSRLLLWKASFFPASLQILHDAPVGNQCIGEHINHICG